MPPVQESPKVPSIAAQSPGPSSELARRGQRTATDANRGSPAESVAPDRAERAARIRSPPAVALVVMQPTTTTTTTPAVPDVARARPGPAIVKRLLHYIGRTQALHCWERGLARTATPSGASFHE
jgi:hypothetical protein